MASKTSKEEWNDLNEEKSKSLSNHKSNHLRLGSIISISSQIGKITYTWKNINVWGDAENEGKRKCCGKNKTHPKPKHILKDVTGIVRSGEVLALMGASGAGKTTLLNILTFQTIGRFKITGERAINGVSIGPNTMTAISGYVQQHDLFFSTITVREHLIFQANLRMHKKISRKQRIQRVDEVISEFGLEKSKNTLIGSPGRIKGISGGEMKRLAFASEILNDPPLLFCDEPTSGLDSFMAKNIVLALKKLASKGITVVCTIHQPSSEVFEHFDRILLMAEGRVAFLGESAKCQEFFKAQNMPCPKHYNPADHYILSLAIRPGSEEESRKISNTFADNFAQSEGFKKIEEEVENIKSKDPEETSRSKEAMSAMKKQKYKASWCRQLSALTWRDTMNIIREPMLLKSRIVESTVVPLFLGLIYFQQELNPEGVQNINGALFFMLIDITFTYMLSVIHVFCGEMPIFFREHWTGVYRSDAYFLAKSIAGLPFQIIFPVIYMSIFYWMVGFNNDGIRFLNACLLAILVANVAISFSYLISCVSPSFEIALAFAPLFVIPIMIFGGFFLNDNSVPVYFLWIKFISWFYYANEASSVNQWEGVEINCEDAISKNKTCPPTGEIILETLSFKKDHYYTNLIGLVALMIGYRLLAYIALFLRSLRKR